MLPAMTRRIALSGGIGSGKSTVTRMLAELGATTIDADAIVHALQAPGSAMLLQIRAAFGAGVITEDGALDREALGAVVFGDSQARARLGAIVHPPVIAEMARRSEAAVAAGAPLLVLDIPLFFEGAKAGTGSAAAREYDACVLVWVPREVQLERTLARDSCTREDAERRIAAQLPIEEKRQMASHVIDNSGSLERTRAQVKALYDSLVEAPSAD